jgi:hypothetical protein
VAYDAILSEWAESFLAGLDPASLSLWEHTLMDQFLSEPENDTTIWYSAAGGTDVRATEIGPFVVIWRSINAEILAIGNIRWGVNPVPDQE